MTKNFSNLFHKVLELEESQVVLVFNAQLFEHLLVLLEVCVCVCVRERERERERVSE